MSHETPDPLSLPTIPLFTPNDFPPISVKPIQLDPLEKLKTQFNTTTSKVIPNSSYVSQALPFVLLSFGKVCWLSSQGGVIRTRDNRNCTFQLNDFCDNSVTDLTKVLRIGFILKFSAIQNEEKEYTATSVHPICGHETKIKFRENKIVEVKSSCNILSKDFYCPMMELVACQFLLGTFRGNITISLPFCSIIAQLSLYAENSLKKYIGDSTTKLRVFIERRTHLFRVDGEVVVLLHPIVLTTVNMLSGYLLRSGGVTSVQNVLTFYQSPIFPAYLRNYFGSDFNSLVRILEGHKWIFAVFPDKDYVSTLRNLPPFNYFGYFDNQFFIAPPLHQAIYQSCPPGLQNDHSQYLSCFQRPMPSVSEKTQEELPLKLMLPTLPVTPNQPFNSIDPLHCSSATGEGTTLYNAAWEHVEKHMNLCSFEQKIQANLIKNASNFNSGTSLFSTINEWNILGKPDELNKSKADTNISSIYGVNEVLTEKFGPINYGPIHN